MHADQWRRLEELFHEAADLPPAEWPGFLERNCADDAELRRELEMLLDADRAEDAGPRLAVDRAIQQLPAEPEERPSPIGLRIGPYSITRLIGKGGMGEVYHAVREDDFRMEVAIKFLKPGPRSEMALRRFQLERQILAGLQHSHIARLLDGGATADGLPYLVMEYVEGVPLLDFVAGLPIRERLKLFLPVCSAVHYAHQRHIVHRDIKPANILVTAAGIPKLLDFGIAKLLDRTLRHPTDDPLTVGRAPMTPEYASPEQIRGDALTRATDIYSLGVVLYELVLGRQVPRPGPAPDGQRLQWLEPDLASIILNALRRLPHLRYASAEELAQDIERFLQDRPVHAHRAGPLYRPRKFLKRHRRPAAASAVTAALSLALLAGVYWRVRPEPASAALRSIAVLPFENRAGQESFAEGMTDTLARELGRIPSVRVVSDSSVMPSQPVQTRLPAIAASLHVGSIAEGSVQRSGDRIHITLRLVDAARDSTLWSRAFEGDVRDILALQKQAAEAAAEQIRAALGEAAPVRTDPGQASQPR